MMRASSAVKLCAVAAQPDQRSCSQFHSSAACRSRVDSLGASVVYEVDGEHWYPRSEKESSKLLRKVVKPEDVDDQSLSVPLLLSQDCNTRTTPSEPTLGTE